jgi:sugar (Glycoside-Pentoside-Hexuronide) transporter
MGKIGLKEKMSYAIGDVGCNFIYVPVTSFLMIYYTDTVGLGVAAVGMLMLIARLLDGITDLTMGLIIDKTNTKWGKTRPWILWSAPFMGLGLVLLFNVPEALDSTGKLIYAYITYIFLVSIIYTISNLSYCTLLARISNDTQERSVLSAIRFFCVILFTIVISMVTNPLVEKFGWPKLSVIYGILACVLLCITFFFTKERNKGGDDQAFNFKKGMCAIKNNKYFFLIALMFILVYADLGLSSGATLYYTTYVLKDANLIGVLTLTLFAPMILVFLILPKVLNKFGKWKVMLMGFLIKLIGVIMMAIDPTCFNLIILGNVVKGIGMAPIMVGIFAIVADVVDYGEWKTGIRADGLINSCVSFGMKLGGGLGTAILGWILGCGGYDSTANIQNAAVISAINMSYIYLGIIFSIIGIIVMCFLNMDKFSDQMSKELQEKAI